MNPSPDLFIWLWAIWAITWSVFAFRTSRTVSAQKLQSRFLHLGLFGLGMILILLHFNTPAIFARRLVPDHPAVGWAGLMLSAIGVGFSICARVYLGRQWSGTVTLKENHALIRSGPYGITRHPIYTGLLAAVFGTALANGTLAAALGFALVLLSILLKIRLEEKVLSAHFGLRYAEYCRAVRVVVPFVW